MTTCDIRDNLKLSQPTLEPWVRGGQADKDIVVLMSGGVDSSVTAMLMKQAGWNVLGITMKIPIAQNCDYKRSCCGMEVGYVCKELGISHYYLDVQDAFAKLVIEPFREAYARGETPSPCVDCNTFFKFGLVWDFIEEKFGVSSFATGHYASVLHTESGARLARAKDLKKDQSYFLYGVPKRRLKNFYLPLGEFTKEEVREMARAAKLPVARRPESMELCFAGEGDYRNALGDIVTGKGAILDTAGSIIGEHSGIANYTVGQRRGIGIAAKQPLYVTRILPEENSIMVGTWDDALESRINVRDVNVLIPDELFTGAKLLGKIRSQGDPSGCTIAESDGMFLSVEFDEPQFGPTPGQRLVLYNSNNEVVAGGIIK